MGPNNFKKIAKMSLELLGLLLELLLLLLLHAFYHVLIRGREAPPYNYVISAYSRSSCSSNCSPSSSRDILAIFFANVWPHLFSKPWPHSAFFKAYFVGKVR